MKAGRHSERETGAMRNIPGTTVLVLASALATACVPQEKAALLAEGSDPVRFAAAAPIVNVAARKAALSKLPRAERKFWCKGSMRKARLGRTATIRGPIRHQKSNAQAASNALFGNIAAYYAGTGGSTALIRDTLAEGARIGAFTELAPYSPKEYRDYNTMNEPVFQVANFMVSLAHAYLILKEEYPRDINLLSAVEGWGDRLFQVTHQARDDFVGRAKGVDRRVLIAAGWAHWGGATNNRDALARAEHYYKRAMRTFGRGGKDRIWEHKGKRRIYYMNMTTAAALTTAYALHRAGVNDVYTMAPSGGTVVEGAAWLWDRLVEGRYSNLLRPRSQGSRSAAWVELFIREFPDHPSAEGMRAWRSKATGSLSGNMGGGPTTCLYRRIP